MCIPHATDQSMNAGRSANSPTPIDLEDRRLKTGIATPATPNRAPGGSSKVADDTHRQQGPCEYVTRNIKVDTHGVEGQGQ